MKGISFSKTENKWLARFFGPQMTIYVGRYKTEELATTALQGFKKGYEISK